MQWLASRLDGRADNTRVTVATATAEPRPPACCPCRSTDLLRPCQQQRRRRGASTAAESRASQWREAARGAGAGPPWGRRIVCSESFAAAASRSGRRGRYQPRYVCCCCCCCCCALCGRAGIGCGLPLCYLARSPSVCSCSLRLAPWQSQACQRQRDSQPAVRKPTWPQ